MTQYNEKYEVSLREIREYKGSKYEELAECWEYQIVEITGGASDSDSYKSNLVERTYSTHEELCRSLIAALPNIKNLGCSFHDATIGPYPNRNANNYLKVNPDGSIYQQKRPDPEKLGLLAITMKKTFHQIKTNSLAKEA